MVFTSKLCEKHLRKSDILSKDPGYRSTSLLKMSLSTGFFTHFVSKNQLTGFSIIGILAGNGSNELQLLVGLSTDFCQQQALKGYPISSQCSVFIFSKSISPANIYLLKINNKNNRKRCEICTKLTTKTPERNLETFCCQLRIYF